MRYVFYIACLGLAAYGVSKINGSHYIQHSNQKIPDNYFTASQPQGLQSQLTR